MSDHANEFTSRDEIAQLVFEKFVDRFISALNISVTEMTRSEVHQKEVNTVIEKISIISYQAADSMRKARLAAFK